MTVKALLVGENGSTFVDTIELPELEKGQLLIKSVAFAANPTDWKHLEFGLAQKNAIVGNDVSGYVEKVGPHTPGFEKGDIVSTTVRGSVSKTQGTFGEYVVANAVGTLKYDKSTFKSDKVLSEGENKSDLINTFEAAAATTLSLGTVGLSFSHHLKLQDDKSNNGKYILIWSGATASGVMAIQVAKKIYGLKVITTASPKNHQFLKSLGADFTFDYSDPNVVEKIKQAGEGRISYGLDTISSRETFQAVYDATEGSEDVRLDNLLFLTESDLKLKPGRPSVPCGGTLLYVIDGKDHSFGPTVIKTSKELLADFTNFWTKLVPPHLSELKSHNLLVLKPGLESANEAFELLKNNKVSAAKVVWRLK